MPLGRRACEEFGVADAQGQWRLAGWINALGVIAEPCDRILFPPPQGRPVPSATVQIDGLRYLSVQVVGDRAHRRIWNTLITDEHPHALTTFAGRQRYGGPLESGRRV